MAARPVACGRLSHQAPRVHRRARHARSAARRSAQRRKQPHALVGSVRVQRQHGRGVDAALLLLDGDSCCVCTTSGARRGACRGRHAEAACGGRHTCIELAARRERRQLRRNGALERNGHARGDRAQVGCPVVWIERTRRLERPRAPHLAVLEDEELRPKHIDHQDHGHRGQRLQVIGGLIVDTIPGPPGRQELGAEPERRLERDRARQASFLARRLDWQHGDRLDKSIPFGQS